MIAAYAGVSRGVVDRVLHGRPNVNPDKRRRVEAALRDLEYTPDRAARALALKNKGMKIAVVMPVWSGSFGWEVDRGLENARAELADFGMQVVVTHCATDLPEEYVEAIDDAIAGGARGLAICARNTEPVRNRLLALVREGIPVVTFNSDIPDSGRMCFVGQDDRRSGRIAAEIMAKPVPPTSPILIACGNREYDGHRRRVEGFGQRMAEPGRDPDADTVVECYNDYDITLNRVAGFLAANPDASAIYMANESVPGCAEALRRSGRAGQVRVVCHDVSETTARLLRERVVDFVIEQNLYLQGSMPVTVLTNYLMAGRKPENEIAYTRIHIACAENIDL